MPTFIKIGSTWAHHSGREYRVLILANTETARPEEYPITVIYQGANGHIWAKPLDNFLAKMTWVKD
jgi:hypothetical protein